MLSAVAIKGMAVTKMVARFADGRVVKGTARHFDLASHSIDLFVTSGSETQRRTRIQTQDLKALFGVKSLVGDPGHANSNDFGDPCPPRGAVRVTFLDGEILVGVAAGHDPVAEGFYLIPADDQSNNEWCYVVQAATQEVCPV